VSFYHAPLRRHTHRSEFDARELGDLPRVDVVAAYVGADDAAARACVAAGARGLAVHGYTYNGRPSADQEAGIAAIAQAIPVALASRGGGGRIPIEEDSPYIRADTFVSHKARILLMLGLTRTTDRRELQRMFSQY
jgi:L-asparaginase